jgi:hypothetical protein
MHLREDLKTHKHAAKQFVDQLEDHWTASFMMALRDAINDELKKNDKECGTNFHREYIDNTCPSCQGEKKVLDTDHGGTKPCPHCRGKGWLSKKVLKDK